MHDARHVRFGELHPARHFEFVRHGGLEVSLNGSLVNGSVFNRSLVTKLCFVASCWAKLRFAWSGVSAGAELSARPIALRRQPEQHRLADRPANRDDERDGIQLITVG
jgi:hypothetical protein